MNILVSGFDVKSTLSFDVHNNLVFFAAGQSYDKHFSDCVQVELHAVVCDLLLEDHNVTYCVRLLAILTLQAAFCNKHFVAAGRMDVSTVSFRSSGTLGLKVLFFLWFKSCQTTACRWPAF